MALINKIQSGDQPLSLGEIVIGLEMTKLDLVANARDAQKAANAPKILRPPPNGFDRV